MAKVSIPGPVEKPTMVSSCKDPSVAMVSGRVLTVTGTRVNGETTRHGDMVSISGRMAATRYPEIKAGGLAWF